MAAEPAAPESWCCSSGSVTLPENRLKVNAAYMAPYPGARMAVGEALAHVRTTLPLLLWSQLLLLLSGSSCVGRSQRHGPPEVVIPLRVTHTGRGVKPPGWLSYSLRVGGRKHVLHMKVNKHLFSQHFPVFTYDDQHALLEDQPFVQNDCYYQGHVEGDPESLVALSTCLRGFRGILQINNIVYEIQPKRLSTSFEHLLYRMDKEETQLPPMRCGLTDEEIARQLKFQESVESTLMQSGYEGWWTHRRFLELAVVVDHNRYLHHESNTSKVQDEVCLTINVIDNILSTIDVHVVLIGIEIWSEQNYLATDDIEDLLSEFCVWKLSGFNVRLPHDVAHIFVKADFGITVGLAYVGSVCQQQYNCGVDSILDDDLNSLGFIVSHELGHNLGMKHDDNTCTCGRKRCVMYPSKSLIHKFSNCSYAYYWDTVRRKSCLNLLPKKESIFMYTRCGNSVLEEGEECDCGSLQTCTKDPCCQPDCTLKPGADCAFGLCCDNCTFRPPGFLCRKEENECDLPEWCNGTSYQCPEDVHRQDGTSCTGGGYCYEKRCNNRNEQCRQIFGKEAKSANQDCYREVNIQGDRFGNCGVRVTSYVKCGISDILCGRVQCENVTKIPVLRDHTTVSWTHFNGVTCWGTDYHFGMTIPDAGEVKDGTECGAGRICIQRKCVLMSTLKSSCSPETCNLNGVCNSRHHCHCHSRWAPPSCLDEGSGGSVDSGPPPQKPEVKKENMLGKRTSNVISLRHACH
uniref:Disintegrin and metalloproteinase domain-containing protein 25-like n=2 Tax=Camelus bactrianus TaxID=9837 RepID=A0A9W3FEE9_CAMBA|nr:disintegrin and metalloproteinase domain-containing protein 25-like [Camelus bactrianus]